LQTCEFCSVSLFNLLFIVVDWQLGLELDTILKVPPSTITLPNAEMASTDVLPCEKQNWGSLSVDGLLKLFESLPGLQGITEFLEASVENSDVEIGLLQERMPHIIPAIFDLGRQHIGIDL